MPSVKQAVTGLDDIFKGLDGLLEAREPVARAMGVAMGQVVRDQAIENAPTLNPQGVGTDNQRPNQLKEAMYLAFDGRRSILNEGYLVYTVSWNAKRAPHGHLIEFGHMLPYEYEVTPDGKFYTPLQGTKRVGGRKRGFGRPNPHTGFFVHAIPFLGPAFDEKLPSLNRIAIGAATLAFSEYKT